MRYDETMKEGGCPFTKMCKLAGTPHVGAILIVVCVIAGAAYYFLVNHNEHNLVSEQDSLNAQLQLMEESSKQPQHRPTGYIKIMNDPEVADSRNGADSQKGRRTDYPYVKDGAGNRTPKTGSAFVFPEDE